MTTPTFLGIGAPRCGTTWLHELMDSHPQIYVPSRRKEVGYFSRYYDRGFNWYCSFFPPNGKASDWIALGEITPDYLFDPQAPLRIKAVRSIDRLIVMIRDPVTRLVSSYNNVRINQGFTGTFNEYISHYPDHLNYSLYGFHLERFLQQFSRDQLLILVFEQAVTDVESTKRRLAEFLGVDPELFPAETGTAKINPSFQTKVPGLYSRLARLNRTLRKYQGMEILLDFVQRITKRANIRKLFRPEYFLEDVPDMKLPPDYVEKLHEDRKRLEDRFNLDLRHWLERVGDSLS